MEIYLKILMILQMEREIKKNSDFLVFFKNAGRKFVPGAGFLATATSGSRVLVMIQVLDTISLISDISRPF